jgi:hypothetical protein
MQTLEDPDCLEAVLQRLSQLTPQTTPQWGRMRATQMVCHLADSYRVLMGLKPAASVETWVGRTVIRVLALHVPLPWPKGVKTGYACDPEGGMTPPSLFTRDLEELQQLLRQFSSGQPGFPGARHPAMGALTRWERLRWGYLHADHHLRQFGL